MNRLFAPVWAGGWTVSRWIFVLAQALELLRQSRQVFDSFQHPTFNFGTGLLHLSNAPLYPVGVAWGVWAAGGLGLAGLGIGGRYAKPGLLVWMAAELALFAGLGWEINAPERIMGWSAVGLLLGPIQEEDLHQKWRSPVGRWFFLIWVGAMYAMAGWMKLFEEPGWWDGSILAQAMADPIMGGTPWGIGMSQVPWIPRLLDGFTLLFECGFCFLIGFSETNPWILGVGLLFHGGVSSLLSVGTLGLTVVGAYPVLLDPETAHRIWERLSLEYKLRRG